MDGDLHGRGRRDDRQRRLAADRLPHARGRAVPRRHVLPARRRGTGCRRSRRCWSRSRSSTASAARRWRSGRRCSSTRCDRRPSAAPSAEPLTESLLFEAIRRLGELHDPEWGGFGARAPKFPPASALELLLRRGEAELAVPTLDAMAAGGMYDLVGGGFHRYSVDERWLVPHFEKMLYDNALLVPAYLHGWLVTGRERYREVVEETVEYLLRDLRLPDGGFASSQDADTDGVEGLTYTWAPGEGAPEELLRAVRGRPLRPARRARPGDAGAAADGARRAAAAGARRQGDRLVERARAGGAGRGGAPARAGGLARRGAGARRVPARPDVA